MSLKGKFALCVGGTSGIGRAVAIKLAQLQANVTIVGRNAQLGSEVLSELHKYNPTGEHSMIVVDATSMKSITKACDEYSHSNSNYGSKGPKPLHYCVLTQGMATMAGRTETDEGIDQKLALHYYGRAMFIRQLTPLLKQTSNQPENNDVRVLSIFSGGVHNSSYSDLSDLDLKKNFTLSNAANAAGFYNDLTLDHLSRTTATVGSPAPPTAVGQWSAENKRGISFIHAAPGAVNTTWGKDFPVYLRAPLRLLQKVIAKSPEDCASLMVEHGLVSAERQGQGFHIMTELGKKGKLTDLHNEMYREKVWQHTNALIDQALERK